jgi:hypothetical protein
MDYVDYAIDDLAPARPPVASFVEMPDAAPELSLANRLLAGPGWKFHVACGLGALGVVWAASAPAGLSAGDPFAWLGFACIVLWAIRAGIAASRRTLTTVFLAAPLMAGVVGAAQYLEIPQETRWMQAQDGFEKALRTLPTAKQWDQKVADETTPGRIGSYWVDGVTRDGSGAVQFRLDSGPFGIAPAAGAVFTYLVDGPTDKVHAANPGATFDHLHGNWYVVNH